MMKHTNPQGRRPVSTRRTRRHGVCAGRISAGLLVCATIVAGTGFGTAGASPLVTDCPDAPANMNVIISDAAEIVGTSGDDFICAGASRNVINGRGGNDIIHAGAGDDVVWGRGGNDEIHGGAGNDNLRGGPGRDSMFGDAGDDVMRGGRGADVLDGSDGNDRINGGSGSDTMVGGLGSDRLAGRSGADEINGGAGADRIVGGAGNDHLHGDSDNDKVVGGAGADTLDGGDGNDYLLGQAGDDTVDGGEGNDKANGGADHDLCSNAETTTECESGVVTEVNNFGPGNDAPVMTVDPDGYSVDENSPAGVAVEGNTPTAIDPNGDPVTFAVVGGTGEQFFNVHPQTGALTVAFSDIGLDHESVDTYTLEIVASDGELFDSEVLTISVSDVNEAPEFSSDMDDFSIDENSVAGTLALGGPLLATDVDGDAVFFDIVDGSGQGIFGVDPISGELSVLVSESELNFEVVDSYTLTVSVSDGELFDALTMVVTVEDVNEAPVIILESNDFWVNAHPQNGDAVEDGEIAASDEDAYDSIAWQITGGDPDGIFGIDAQSGALFVADEEYLDHNGRYKLALTVVDLAGLTDSVTIVIQTVHV